MFQGFRTFEITMNEDLNMPPINNFNVKIQNKTVIVSDMAGKSLNESGEKPWTIRKNTTKSAFRFQLETRSLL